jgi:hypothetical protein
MGMGALEVRCLALGLGHVPRLSSGGRGTVVQCPWCGVLHPSGVARLAPSTRSGVNGWEVGGQGFSPAVSLFQFILPPGVDVQTVVKACPLGGRGRRLLGLSWACGDGSSFAGWARCRGLSRWSSGRRYPPSASVAGSLSFQIRRGGWDRRKPGSRGRFVAEVCGG